MYCLYGRKVILTVNRDDMNNPEYGTKENPVPVLKDVGVDESSEIMIRIMIRRIWIASIVRMSYVI